MKLLASALFGKLDSTSQKTINLIGKFIKNIRQIFTFDEFTGTSRISVDITSEREETSLHEIFLSPKRPFYQNTQILSIDKINKDNYYRFAADFFIIQGKELAYETLSMISSVEWSGKAPNEKPAFHYYLHRQSVFRYIRINYA